MSSAESFVRKGERTRANIIVYSGWWMRDIMHSGIIMDSTYAVFSSSTDWLESVTTLPLDKFMFGGIFTFEWNFTFP